MRVVSVTTGKINCSTKCSLDGTRRTTLRDCWKVTDSYDSSTRKESTVQYSEEKVFSPASEVRFVCQKEYRMSTVQEPEYRTEKTKSLVHVV
jgi:hypothetical protein